VVVSTLAPAEPAENRAVLSLRGIEKSYPGVRALADVDLDIASGTVHGLVGENGAGKSTLLKIVSGAIPPDAGTIAVAGEPVTRLTPRLARRLGIRMVSQERQIAGDLSVGENVLLGRLPRGRSGRVDWRAVRREAQAKLEQVGLEIDPHLQARRLSVAQLQSLEIARALSAQARLIVMDEPTAALGAGEIELLFANIRGLREFGVSILYVSHHLEEIFEIAETVTVLRDGALVATRPCAALTSDGLVELVLGRSPEALALATEIPVGDAREVVLRVQRLARAPALREASFELRAGEILCVTGAIGSGRRELARCVAGIERPDAGRIELRGRDHRPRSPRNALRHGVAFLPEDRKREGLLLDLDLVDNVGIGRLALARDPLVRPRVRRRTARELCARLRVRPAGLSRPVRLLSGGNQQKAMLARWLAVGARVFVLDEPTAGIDIGTKVEIYRLLRLLSAEGVALLVLSSDFEEIKVIADRVLVLRKGVVAGDLRRDQINERRMLALQVGAG
jgi:ABC-type sugar transport system ATPase subunit